MKLIPGIYKHFKTGNLYRVHTVATNATNNSGGKAMVFYEALDKTKCEADEVTETGFFVRDLAEFTESVVWPDGIYRARWVLADK